MKAIDLFAGAGGLSEGFRRAGFDIVAHVEKDFTASLTLKTREAYYYLKDNSKMDIYIKYLSGKISRQELYENIPEEVLNKVINQEISDETNDEIFNKIDKLLNGEPVRIILGGPPCQAYSLVGRSRDPNRMKNDPRNYLYKQYLKYISRYRPEVFVFENVSGLLSANNGVIFDSIQNDMRTLGYNIDYRLLNSRDFGVLQSRRRIILIGWIDDLDFQYPDFNVIENEYTIKDLFLGLPNINAGDKIDFEETQIEINNCLKELHINNDFNYITQHIARPNNKQDLEIYRLCVDTWDRESRQLKYNELPENLISHTNKKIFLDRFKVVPYEGISHTVVSHISKDGHYYIHPDINQNRSITVREAARVQSFPDDYYFESSRTAAFKQIGNAVPPLMAETIAESIKEVLDE
ncbi:DNA (cytosine-5-)-methyltransferase [Tissierella sp. P1]|uniref:DNA cytosine methyltransferase n=1 Tax=Tissierella sp. P1 TaxID=1280483 RepID=UPI000BA1786C|nr:DNA (cytosine-5-)-methyltransferase [Tissierella sp. P1]OZV13546.1 DNA (cytosine-5-)-methyltransferase [Tissierella sp. P1]